MQSKYDEYDGDNNDDGGDDIIVLEDDWSLYWW